jgi:hypothetical protein
MADEWVFGVEMKPWKKLFINITGKNLDIRIVMMIL